MHAANLTTVALTLHRMDDPCRRMGLELFESLLDIRLPDAEAALREIDLRLPARRAGCRHWGRGVPDADAKLVKRNDACRYDSFYDGLQDKPDRQVFRKSFSIHASTSLDGRREFECFPRRSS